MVTRRSPDEEPPSLGQARADGRGSSSAPPSAETEGRSSGPSLTVAAVARRLGVAPATLRTWDRRYGLGPSEHLAGSHRRYSSSDVGRLLVMRRLTLEGVAPSSAARTALLSDESAPSATSMPSTSGVIDAFSDAVPMAADPAAIVAAAAHFDNAAVRWMLARVHPRDVVAWWSDLVEPALRTLDERAVLERPGESAGPALTAAAFAELRSRAAVSNARSQSGEQAPRTGRPVSVLVIPVGSGPDLLVHVLATALQAGGVRARVLSGGRSAAVTSAVDRLVPTAVLLDVGADEDEHGRAAAVVRAVSAASPGVPVFVHRAGSGALDLPVTSTVHRVRTLTGALHEILAVVS